MEHLNAGRLRGVLLQRQPPGTRNLLEVLERRICAIDRRLLEIGCGHGSACRHSSPVSSAAPRRGRPATSSRICRASADRMAPQAALSESAATASALDVLDDDAGPASDFLMLRSPPIRHISWATTRSGPACSRVCSRLTPLTDGRFLSLWSVSSWAGKHTSGSNAAFDHSLRMRNPQMGIARDLDELRTNCGDRHTACRLRRRQYAMPSTTC